MWLLAAATTVIATAAAAFAIATADPEVIAPIPSGDSHYQYHQSWIGKAAVVGLWLSLAERSLRLDRRLRV